MSGVYQQSPKKWCWFQIKPPDPARTFVAAADGSCFPVYPEPRGNHIMFVHQITGIGTVDWETITKPEFGFDAAQGNNTDGLIDPVTNVVKLNYHPEVEDLF